MQSSGQGMRILVACDSDPTVRAIRAALARHDVDCPAGHAVGLELACDRASRIVPDLLLLVLPSEPGAGLSALHEIRGTVPSAQLLVVGPATDAKLILEALHVGADEFLDEMSLDTELAAALCRFRAREDLPRERGCSGRVIGVLAPSGGAGASTVAVNVSIALAQRHQESGLIDLRLGAGDLAPMLNVQPARTLADLCDQLARLDRSMFEQALVRHHSGVSLLAAPIDFADMSRVTCRGIRRILAIARGRFPYVVVDLDHVFRSEQVEALWQSDEVLLVIRLDYTSVRNARRILDTVAQLGMGVERVRVVANTYGQRKQLRVGQAEEALGMRLHHYVCHDAAAVHQAINQGIPVVLKHPRAKISRNLRDLALSINGHCPET